MSNKEKNATEEVKTEEQVTETPKKVTINIPKTRDDKGDVYVCVNGRSVLIKRGVNVEVSPEVAEVLKHSQDADLAAMEFIERMEAQYEGKFKNM